MRTDAATRRARRLLRRGTWTEAARFVAWSALGARPADASRPLSWPLSAQELADVTVRWPRRYAWPNAKSCLEPIRLGISQHVQVVPADLPQNPGNFVAFELVRDSRVLRVAVDYDDLPVLHPDATRMDLCFKLQFQRGGYADGNVIPGGYIAPRLALYRYARRWRALGERATESPIFARFSPSSDVRRELLATMREAGWTSERVVVGSSWLEFMHDLSQAPICLDAPGRGETCFRLVEALATGACVVGPQLESELHVPTDNAVVRVRRDHSDLIATCEQLLQEPAQRAELRARAAEYFDRFLDLAQLGAYYVSSMIAGSAVPPSE